MKPEAQSDTALFEITIAELIRYARMSGVLFNERLKEALDRHAAALIIDLFVELLPPQRRWPGWRNKALKDYDEAWDTYRAEVLYKLGRTE